MRSYSTEWEKDRLWLKLTDNGMVCLACQAHGDKTVMNQFISGCVSYKLDSIQKHQKSTGHEKSPLIEKAKNESKAESKAKKIIQTLNTENFQKKLDKMLRNVHAMVQHSRPLGDYVWMCELDEMKGVQLGTTYCNQKFANVLIKAIKNSKFSWGGGMPPNPLACSDRFTVLTGDTWALTFTPGLPDFYNQMAIAYKSNFLSL